MMSAPGLITFLIAFASLGLTKSQTQTSLPIDDYSGLTVDSTGTNMMASIKNGPIYYSVNSGSSWMLSNAPNPEYYVCIASSSNDGQYGISMSTGSTYVSSNYGQTWTEFPSSYGGSYTSECAVSSTGQYMAVVNNVVSASTCVSYSNDFGATLTTKLGPSGASGFCQAVAIDSTGTYLVVSVAYQGLWMSNNPSSASSWTQTYSTSTKISAIAYGGGYFYAGYSSYPYTFIQSSNNGASWVSEGFAVGGFDTISVDSSGKNILAAISGGLYYSSDMGQSFSLTYPNSWTSVCAIDAAGTLAVWNAGTSGQSQNVYLGNPTTMSSDWCDSSPCPTSCPAGYTGGYWTSSSSSSSSSCQVYCTEQPTYGQCAPGGSGCTSSCSLAPGIIAAIVISVVAAVCCGLCFAWYYCFGGRRAPLTKQEEGNGVAATVIATPMHADNKI